MVAQQLRQALHIGEGLTNVDGFGGGGSVEASAVGVNRPGTVEPFRGANS